MTSVYYILKEDILIFLASEVLFLKGRRCDCIKSKQFLELGEMGAGTCEVMMMLKVRTGFRTLFRLVESRNKHFPGHKWGGQVL